MRMAVLGLAIVLAGCSRPVAAPVVPPAPETSAPAASIVVEPVVAPPPRTARDPWRLLRMESYRNHSDPLLRDLARGHIQAGDDIEALARRNPHYHVVRFGDYVVMEKGMGQGGTLVAGKGGKVWFAWTHSCVCQDVFIGAATIEHLGDFFDGYPSATRQKPALAPPPRDVNTERLHVPQDAYNLAQIELLRKVDPGLTRDLATGRVKYGSAMEDVVSAYKPDVLFQDGDYTTAVYADGSYLSSLSHTYVVAKNGKLVRAWLTTCKWHPTYFNGLTEAERKTWNEGYWKFHADYLDAVRSRRNARIAVAGPIATAPATASFHIFE
jgi:hypothetical protein